MQITINTTINPPPTPTLTVPKTHLTIPNLKKNLHNPTINSNSTSPSSKLVQTSIRTSGHS